MLSDCKPGDWVKLCTEQDITKLGKVIEIDSGERFNGYYDIEWYVRIGTQNNYSSIRHRHDGLWHPHNHYIIKHEPTIEEIFKIKQTLEKE